MSAKDHVVAPAGEGGMHAAAPSGVSYDAGAGVTGSPRATLAASAVGIAGVVGVPAPSAPAVLSAGRDVKGMTASVAVKLDAVAPADRPMATAAAPVSAVMSFGDRKLNLSLPFVVAPREIDSDTGLPIVERYYGICKKGCNGLVITAHDVGACDRKVNALCVCPTGPKCATCCRKDWLFDMREAVRDDGDLPTWVCTQHRVPSKAMQHDAAIEQEQADSKAAAIAMTAVANSPVKRRVADDRETYVPSAPATPVVSAAVAKAWELTESPPSPAVVTKTVAMPKGSGAVTARASGVQQLSKTVALPRATTDSKAAPVAGAASTTMDKSRRSKGLPAAPFSPSSSDDDASATPGASDSDSRDSSESDDSTDSADDKKVKKSKRKAKAKRKTKKARAATAASSSERSADAASATTAVAKDRLINAFGDEVSRELWRKSQSIDANAGRSGTRYDQCRSWFRETQLRDVSEVERRATAVRWVGLLEFLDSIVKPNDAVTVAKRMVRRELMAMRCARHDASGDEAAAAKAMINAGLGMTRKIRKGLRDIDGGDTSFSGSAGNRGGRGVWRGRNGNGGGSGNGGSGGGGGGHGGPAMSADASGAKKN
jgi:hypothetical protein